MWNLVLRLKRKMQIGGVRKQRADVQTYIWTQKTSDRRMNKLHNKKIHNLYSSRNIVRVSKSGMKWARHIARMGELWNSYKILVGKPEAKRPLCGPRCRWEVNIKIDLKEMSGEDVDWIQLAQYTTIWWQHLADKVDELFHIRRYRNVPLFNELI
jgi:hypothetical protein